MPFVVFDVETRIDKALLKAVLCRGEEIAEEEAFERARAHAAARGGRGSDFLPLAFHVPISIVVGTVDDERVLTDVMVDTGSEYTWLPRSVLEELGVPSERIERFETADGRVLEREVGFEIISAAGRSTPTIVAFAESGDMILLGAMGLEGMNLRVDLGRKELVPAGPVPVAAAA